jgi:hypothetical protein
VQLRQGKSGTPIGVTFIELALCSDDDILLAESDFSSKIQLDDDLEFKSSGASKPVTLKVHWNVIAADKSA